MAAMEEQTSTEKSNSTRLYVGGLGERVTQDDLRNTFSNLGSLQTIEIIRTKGRSFAYINFIPSSDNSLAKLFSMYNGCSWKGGKLKLEKAKEHYMDRLKREWAEDAELQNCENSDDGGVDAEIVSTEPKTPIDLENMQFRLFFPKLRKMQSLPLRGTGKHKYSFQRLPAPPVPVHICDCPEHSMPVDAPKVSQVHSHPGQTLRVSPLDNSNVQNAGVDEEEFNMMNSVINRILGQESAANDVEKQDVAMTEEEINVMNSALKKILDKETPSTAEKQDLDTLSQQTVSTSADEEENYIDDETDDDDDIKINAVSRRTRGSVSSSLRRQQSLANQMAKSNVRLNNSDLTRQNTPGFPNKSPNFNKKRKSLSDETNGDRPLSVHERFNLLQQKSLMEPDTQISAGGSAVSEKGTQCSSSKRKSSWTQLIGGDNASTFSISQILH